MPLMHPISCPCPCGAAETKLHATPLMRVRCHCTVCQKFNDAPFADVVVGRLAEATLPADGLVEFGTYRPPPNVDRGRCAACRKPAVEKFHAPIMPDLVMVPASTFADPARLPLVQGDIFYNRRVADIDDDLPKYNGYIFSQIAFLRWLLAGMRRE